MKYTGIIQVPLSLENLNKRSIYQLEQRVPLLTTDCLYREYYRLLTSGAELDVLNVYLKELNWRTEQDATAN